MADLYDHGPSFQSMAKDRTHLTKQPGSPCSKNSGKRSQLYPSWSAEVGHSHCGSEAGEKWGGGVYAEPLLGRQDSFPSPLRVPCLYGRVGSIGENNSDECHRGEPFIGKLFGDTSKT